jgi:hypothetical protein
MKYNQGKVYKMVSPSGLTYVGSTTQRLTQRKAGHKSDFNAWKGGNEHYVSSYKLFEEDPDNIDIVLLEACNVNTKEELHARERHWIELTECVNKVIPIRSRDEKLEYLKKYRLANHDEAIKASRDYYNSHKDEQHAQKKEYYQANKEKIIEYNKQYREKEEIKERNKLRDKNYYETHKAEIAKKKKAYSEAHKDETKARASAPSACECGSIVRTGGKARHLRSEKHKIWTEKKDN